MQPEHKQAGSLLVVVVAISALVSLLILHVAEQIELSIKGNVAGLVSIQKRLRARVNINLIKQCLEFKQSVCEGYDVSLLGQDGQFAYYQLESDSKGERKIFAIALTT